MNSFFNGIARAQWPFDNPNILGAVLGLVIVSLLGIPRGNTGKSGIFLLLIPIAAVASWQAMTMSRGAFVSTFVGLVISGALFSHSWRSVGIVLAVYALTWLLSGEAAGRLATNPVGDASVLNRLRVWNGSLSVIKDNLIAGCGGGNFGREFYRWHQDLGFEQRYLTAVNDYLTFAANWGVLAILALVILVMSAMTIVIREVKSGGGTWNRLVVVGSAYLMIPSGFSSLMHGSFFYFILSLSYLILLMRSAAACSRSTARKVLVVASAMAFSVIAALYMCHSVRASNESEIIIGDGSGVLRVYPGAESTNYVCRHYLRGFRRQYAIIVIPGHGWGATGSDGLIIGDGGPGFLERETCFSFVNIALINALKSREIFEMMAQGADDEVPQMHAWLDEFAPFSVSGGNIPRAQCTIYSSDSSERIGTDVLGWLRR